MTSILKRRWALACCGAIALAAAMCLARGVVRHRTREYDRWKTHGFGLYLFFEGPACYVSLRGPYGRVVGEQVAQFDQASGRWEVAALDPQNPARQEFIQRGREAAAAFRKDRALNSPRFMARALCDSRRRIIYYGSAPVSAFTKMLTFDDRQSLLFTSGGLRQWRTLHSDRFHLVFGRADCTGEALGIEVRGGTARGLSLRLRPFGSLEEAEQKWLARYAYTNLRLVMGRMPVWDRRG